MPYAICIGGINECPSTINGIGVDAANNQIYFAQICRTESLATNVTIKRVGAYGGVPTIVQSRLQQQAAINPAFIFDVIRNDLYLSIEARAPGQPLVNLDLTTLVQSDDIYTGDFFKNAIDFDVPSHQTFTCGLVFINATSNYTISRFEGILGKTTNVSTRHTLYTFPGDTVCTAVRKQDGNTDLYFSTQEFLPNSQKFVSKLYRGSSTCFNCQTTPTMVLSLNNQRIEDFDVTADRIFYGTSQGVFSSNFSGMDIRHISFSGATGVRTLNNRVYWNSGSAILSVNSDGSGLRQVNRFSGTCGCKTSFYGPGCTSCSGQVQWLKGHPRCVAIGDDGNPVSCTADYQCNNNPYTYCAGTCMCQPGLTGPFCDRCANTSQSIVFVNEIPVCQ